jgi:stage II sporulation SpoAA-like protein
MVTKIEDMPAGTIGFRASGKLSPEDYKDVLEPTLREAVEAGEVRMLFVLSDFEELEPRAWLEDAKTGIELGFLKHSAWKRSAIVSDAGWVKKAFRMFAWMTPGEVEVFDLDQEDEARSWVAG